MTDFPFDDAKLAKTIDFLLNGEEEGPHAFVLLLLPNAEDTFKDMLDTGIGISNMHVMSNMTERVATSVLLKAAEANARKQEEEDE